MAHKQKAGHRRVPGFFLGTRAPFWFFCRKAKNPVEAYFQLGAVKKAAVQRSCKRLLFGYKGPGFGSFAGRQKIQWVCTNLMA